MQPIEERLRGSLRFRAYDGNSTERAICGKQMKKAADEITRLRARVAELEKEAQFLRSAHARCRIELDLAERLLDPSYEMITMDEDYRTSLHDRIQAMATRVTELERFWTPVTESLPPLEVPVWLIDTGGNIWIGARTDDLDGWLWANTGGFVYYDAARGWCASLLETDEDYRPAHWAHLPQPPKEAAS